MTSASRIDLLASDLGVWDERLFEGDTIDLLVLPLHSDERPLRGAAGLADWRLHGYLSRLLIKGVCAGHSNEAVLIPGTHRLPFARVMLIGVGRKGQMDESRFEKSCGDLHERISKSAATSYAVELPGRSQGIIAAPFAFEHWTQIAGGVPGQGFVLERGDALGELSDSM